MGAGLPPFLFAGLGFVDCNTRVLPAYTHYFCFLPNTNLASLFYKKIKCPPPFLSFFKRFDIIYNRLTWITMVQKGRLASFFRPWGLIWFSICRRSLSPIASTTLLILLPYSALGSFHRSGSSGRSRSTCALTTDSRCRFSKVAQYNL